MDHHHAPEHAAEPIDDEALRAYLADILPADRAARVEKALRDSSELRERLEAVRQGREDSSLHSLGAIWRRSRLTCPSRQQLGSLLLDALDPDLADYVRFHVEVVECAYCAANLADLQGKAESTSPAARNRHARILHSSRHLLPEDRT
jgi:hypothetical protein